MFLMYNNKEKKRIFYGLFEFEVSLFLLLTSNTIFAQFASNQEQFDDIDIYIDASPYSIKFSLNDTRNYVLENIICRNIKNEEIIANEQHICENLKPCSSYLAVLTIKSVKKQQSFEKTCDAKTEYIEPITEIVGIKTYDDKINLTWTTSDRSCVSLFIVIANSTDATATNQLLNDRSFYLFDALLPCQQYELELQTFDNESIFISNETRSVTTQYSEPGDIKLTISNLENGETIVTWEPPDKKTCIEYIILHWYQIECISNISNIESTTLSEYNSFHTSFADEKDSEQCERFENLTDYFGGKYSLSNLQGCEEYVFEMFINKNATSKAKRHFTSAEKLPGIITKQNWNISSTSIEMNWSRPKDHHKCLLQYWIQLNGPTQRGKELTINKSTVDTKFIFENLDPCGQYYVKILPQSLNGSIGPKLEENFTMLETQPTQIINPIVVAKAYVLTISWQIPKFSDLCIEGYRLSGWRDDNETVEALSKKTTETFVVYDKGLNSCQAYTIQIIPTTREMDGELIQIEVETAPIVVDVEKTTLQVVTALSDSFELSAQSKDFNNTCHTIFAHFYCEASNNVPYMYSEKYVEGHVGDISFKATLSPLTPYTDYECHVVLYNIAGPSNDKRIICSTKPYFPDKPQEVGLIHRTNNSLTFRWKIPNYPNGDINFYILFFQYYEPAYFVPSDCTRINADSISTQTSSLEYNFTNLMPATKYSIQVATQNIYGIGQYTVPKIYETLPWISDPVINLKVIAEGPYESDTEYRAHVLVSWTVPCKSNGEIEVFVLHFFGERPDHKHESFKRTVAPEWVEGLMKYNETRLQPEYNYTVTVAVKSKNVEIISVGVSEQFDAPAGIPKALNETVVGKIRVNAYETNHPTSSAVARIPVDVLESNFGTIIYIALLLSQKNCGGTPELRFGAIDANQDWPDIQSWQEVYVNGNSGCIEQYQTTPLRWKPVINTKINSINLQSDILEEIIYTIGEDKCASDNQRYCNGPLRPDTEYNLVVRLFTKSGYNDAALLEFKTDTAIQVTLILVSVCCCLFLAFVIGLIVLWIKKRIAWHRDSGQGIEDPFGNITAKNFAIFYSEVSKPEKLAREFKEISVAALELSYSASELGCHKNRYADIYPYDKNRVILDIDAEGSDYINASFIDGYTRKKEYIATQGPKFESTMDFWRMILQHNVRIIVMVTQFREGNQIKCHEYFPYSYKGINVIVKSKENGELFDKTEMSVSHDKYGLKQKVIHFYFKKWPDHGCPEDPMHLVNFIQKVKIEKRPNYSPIVVHCSAGVGRTGTFIGLDIVMQRLRSESKINIFETVKKLRFQRMKMVQTLEQYFFLYKCTYELVKHKIPRAALKYDKKNISKKASFIDIYKDNLPTITDCDEQDANKKHKNLILSLPAKANDLTATISSNIDCSDQL